MSFSLRKDNCFNVELMMWWWKFYFRDVFLTFQRCETYLLMVKRKISMPMIFLKRHKNRIFCQNPGDLWWPPTSKIMFFSAVFRKVWWPLVTFFWWPHWWPQPGGHQRSPEKKKHVLQCITSKKLQKIYEKWTFEKTPFLLKNEKWQIFFLRRLCMRFE